MVEVEAPKGYILDETVKEVTFEYRDGKVGVIEYKLAVSNKPTEPKLPQTGDNFNPWLYGGIGAVALTLGVAVLFWKKKDDKEEA